MLVHVTVHLDLRPEKNRQEFNDDMEHRGWKKLMNVFTTWYRRFEAATLDAAREEAMKIVREAANSAGVTFEGVVVAGNTPPVLFDSKSAKEMSEDDFYRSLVDIVMPSSRRR